MQVVQGAGASGGLLWCVPSLCPFAAFAFLQYLRNMPYLAFLGRFQRVLRWLCGFVLFRCFALIVGRFMCVWG